MSYDTLEALNETSPMNVYYADSIFFHNRSPKIFLFYIKEYLKLPESEIMKHGFSINNGAPPCEDIWKYPRLLEKLGAGIKWYASHQLSLYSALIDELLEMDIDTIQVHHLYTLRKTINAFYKRMSRILQNTPKFEVIIAMDEEYKSWFKTVDEKLLGKTVNSLEVLSDNQINDELEKQSKLSVIQRVIHEKMEYIELRGYNDSHINNNVKKLSAYIEHCTTEPEYYQGLYLYFDNLLDDQEKYIIEYVGAIVYGVLIKEMMFYTESQTDKMYPFVLREAIRMFDPPKTQYTSEPDLIMIYPDADMKKLYDVETMNNNAYNEWASWYENMIAEKIPLLESRSWMQLLHFGRDYFGRDPIEVLQQEYNKKAAKFAGYTPLEVHGVITNTTGKEIQVVIYGEIHNQIDNQFYKKQSFDQRKDKTVWVEHNATTPILKPGEEALFTRAKGSEWVWFHRVQKGLPVTCIDIRMKLGLPSAVMEDALRIVVRIPSIYKDPVIVGIRNHYIQTHNLQDIHVFMRYLAQIIKIYKSLKNHMKVMDDLYMLFFREINKQFQMIKRTLDSTNSEEINYPSQFLERTELIVINMLRLNAFVVDAHIINLLKSYHDTKPIAIFVGMNHACRLSRILDWEYTPGSIINPKGHYYDAINTLTPAYPELPKYKLNMTEYLRSKLLYTNDVNEYRVPSLQKEKSSQKENSLQKEKSLQKSVKRRSHVSKKRSPHKTYKAKKFHQY
jgi:hypothetical protein